jgi:hypothetical protein
MMESEQQRRIAMSLYDKNGLPITNFSVQLSRRPKRACRSNLKKRVTPKQKDFSISPKGSFSPQLEE